MLFNQIHLAKKAFPSLHLKVGQKDIIHSQILLASNENDYLMIDFRIKHVMYIFSEWHPFDGSKLPTT